MKWANSSDEPNFMSELEVRRSEGGSFGRYTPAKFHIVPPRKLPRTKAKTV
jgi:hypothetical protein